MSVRTKANRAKQFRCKDLICVLENPKSIENVGSTLRNLDAFGVEKLYVIDGNNLLPKNWEAMRERKSLNSISASAIKWKFVRVFEDTASCLGHLVHKHFMSFATSPHVKGKVNTLLSSSILTHKRLAIWFGNESRGLSEEALNGCVQCLNIPMGGIIESLNLGTTTGIVLYEASRQRMHFIAVKELQKRRIDFKLIQLKK